MRFNLPTGRCVPRRIRGTWISTWASRSAIIVGCANWSDPLAWCMEVELAWRIAQARPEDQVCIVAVNRAGLHLCRYDLWYSYHGRELSQWAKEYKPPMADVYCWMREGAHDIAAHGNLFSGGSSALGAVGLTMDKFGPQKILLANVHLTGPYLPYRKVWNIEAQNEALPQFVRAVDGPLVELLGEATPQWYNQRWA